MTIKPPPSQDSSISLVHKIYDVYTLFHGYLTVFPKQERHSLGNRIENTILDILEYVRSAEYRPYGQKKELLLKASDKTDLLKMLVRLAYGIKALDQNGYIVLEAKVIEIGKIIGGWLKTV